MPTGDGRGGSPPVPAKGEPSTKPAVPPLKQLALVAAALDSTLERVNISLPRRALRRLDARARNAGQTRSGFIARMALDESSPAQATL